jgi:hypothetical protein
MCQEESNSVPVAWDKQLVSSDDLVCTSVEMH